MNMQVAETTVTTPKKKVVSKKKAKTAKTKKASLKKTKVSKDTIKRRADGLRVGSSGALLVDSVCRAKGATHAELCAIIQWKACLPFMLKSAQQAGVKLKKEKQEDGQIRYFGARKKS